MTKEYYEALERSIRSFHRFFIILTNILMTVSFSLFTTSLLFQDITYIVLGLPLFIGMVSTNLFIRWNYKRQMKELYRIKEDNIER